MIAPARRRRRRLLAWLGVALLVGALGGWLGARAGRQPPALDRWDSAIAAAAARTQATTLDPHLLKALVAAESGGDPEALSRAGAVGLCQLLPSTAQEVASGLGLGPVDAARLRDPELNLRLGAEYLARMLRAFAGEEAFAVAAYNAGATHVRRWRERAPHLSAREVIRQEGFEETRRHVERVLAWREAYAGR